MIFINKNTPDKSINKTIEFPNSVFKSKKNEAFTEKTR